METDYRINCTQQVSYETYIHLINVNCNENTLLKCTCMLDQPQMKYTRIYVNGWDKWKQPIEMYLHTRPASDEIYTHLCEWLGQMETNSFTYPALLIKRNVLTSRL